jgi:hypothetical protein
MEAVGTPKRSIWPVEEQVGALVDDDEFWALQANSLAIFALDGRLVTFRLPNRLQNRVEVSDRVHLKPLLRAVTFPHNAYILALSIGACRLVEVSPDLPPHDVRVPGLPKNFNDALGKRSHTENRAGMTSGESTSESAMLHRYARTVDQALRPVLAGKEPPLIVAAAEPLASIARSVSSYPHTAAEVIAGSPDQTPDHQLADAARGILDRIYADRLAELAGLYATRQGEDRATADVARAARAATFGAIDTLVVDMDDAEYGTISDTDGNVTFAEGPGAETYGLIDEIAGRALLSGARIVAARRADIPGGGSLAAILRYPI